MAHWPFVIAAYGVTIGSTAALCVWAWWAMRSRERRVAELREGQGE